MVAGRRSEMAKRFYTTPAGTWKYKCEVNMAIDPTWQSEDGRIQLWQDDCLQILPEIGKVDAVITDPP